MKSTKILLLTVVLLILVCINPTTAAVPVAQFKGNPTTGAVPLTVKFTEKSTGSPTGWAWYFGDETYNSPWTQITPSAEWSTRRNLGSVVKPDGSIFIIGGGDPYSLTNDVWRSTDKGMTWTQITANGGWLSRYMHSCVLMSDGSIVLMGGARGSESGFLNDVWRSTDNGATWTQMTANAEWSPRSGLNSVAMPDGSIVMMGGEVSGSPYISKSDVWRSTDNGATWVQMNNSPGWTPRDLHSSVVMPDGSIILMGGRTGLWGPYANDVWRSTDNGATWTELTTNAGWLPREESASVVMPDGSIILMGGWTGTSQNDAWRSIDMGTTWTQVSTSAGWSARYGHSSVVIPDGSIVLMGGDSPNDVWRLMTAGSSEENPSHVYTTSGIYNVALQAFNANGFASTKKLGYITVTPPPSITVTSPNGGEFWTQGTSHTIIWDYTGAPGSTVKIELLNGDTVYKVLTQSTSIGKANHGSYSWKISATTEIGSNYKIRVTSKSNSVYSDTSDATFSIN